MPTRRCTARLTPGLIKNIARYPSNEFILYLRASWNAPSDRPRVGCKFSITTCQNRLLPSVLYREIRKERISVRRSVHECRIIRAIEAEREGEKEERDIHCTSTFWILTKCVRHAVPLRAEENIPRRLFGWRNVRRSETRHRKYDPLFKSASVLFFPYVLHDDGIQ